MSYSSSESQDMLWQYVQGKTHARPFEVTRIEAGGHCLQIPVDRDRPAQAVCQVSSGLSEDLQRLKKRQRGSATWGTCEVSTLETVAFDERDERATKQFGRAGLVLVPVLQGYLDVMSA